MKIRLAAAFAACTLALTIPAAAQSPKPLFASSDPVQLTIRAPLSTIIRNRQTQTPISGTLTDPTGNALPVTLTLRGITRRTSEICDFPPLRVNFVGTPPGGSLFAGQNKLKLVTHCRNSTSFQQHVLLEYAAYRMYNLLTPRSFGVRLANITYVDGDGRQIASRPGFFIEELKDVAGRNGTVETHGGERIPVSWLSPADSGRYALFQHMIGNHDWSMRAGPAGDDCCHNAPLIGPQSPGGVMPIPYDFDFSGMVGAPYATPPDELGISDVRQRSYRGYCMHNAAVLAAAQQMRSERPQLLAILAQTPGLAARAQQTAAAYLERFFADISTDANVSAKVLSHCIG
jgi:hypothetical protein